MTLGATSPSHFLNALVPTPACPDDGLPWDSVGRCPKCGLEQADVNSLLASACAEYDRAREAALQGRYADARTGILTARGLGLRHEALDRLEALCAAVTGDWERVSIAGLPVTWQEELARHDATPVTLTQTYKGALEAALAARWPEAVKATEACLDVAPWLMPARKLNVLSLNGAGQTEDALRACRVGLDSAPEEPDLIRWHGELVADVAAQRPPSPNVTDNFQKTPPGTRTLKLVGVGFAAVSLMLGFVGGRIGTQTPPVTMTELRPSPMPPLPHPIILPTPPHSVSSAPTPVHTKGADVPFPDDLQRQLGRSRRRADLRQARRWLHTAARAYSLRHYGLAAHFASAAARLGWGSGVAPPARRLLIRATKQATHTRPGDNP